MNKHALDLIKSFEGLRLKAYRDTGGVWTIGYGETRGVSEGQIITKAQAEDMLTKRVAIFESGVHSLVKVTLNDKQLGALISFAYNLGLDALAKSTLLKLINAGKLIEAAAQFSRWNKDNGVVLKGLVKRRAAEQDLFVSN